MGVVMIGAPVKREILGKGENKGAASGGRGGGGKSC